MANHPTPEFCGNCKGVSFTRKLEQPESGAGCLIAIIGALLTPALIGLPLVVLGVHMATKGDYWDICNSCGTKLPAGTQTSAAVYLAAAVAFLLATAFIVFGSLLLWRP